MNQENRRVEKIVNRNKRRQQTKAFVAFCFVSIIVFTMFFAGFKISAITTGAKGLDSGSYSKMYKSVMVERDDSLWDIAERNMGVGYSDTKEYIAEIIELNNLSGTEIHFGEYLCVPYYG